MIDIQRPLSPVLASLLLKEFPHEELAALGCAISSADKAAAERFYIGLEEHVSPPPLLRGSRRCSRPGNRSTQSIRD